MKARAKSLTTVRKALETKRLQLTERENARERHKLVASLVMLAGTLVILFGRYVMAESFFLFLLIGLGVLVTGMYRFQRIRGIERKEHLQKQRQLGLTK